MRTFIKIRWRRFKIKQAVKLAKNKSWKLLNNYDRIYHIHIRKSAGTSLNSALWSLGDLSLKKLKREPIAIGKKLVFVRNNKNLIDAGNYFYGNSHIPFWNLNLPKKTFTYCMLRDPYKRLVSLYKYYIWISKTPRNEALKVEPYYDTLLKTTHWLGNNFSDFLDNIPSKNIANQLYMFSKTYNIKEAINNIERVDEIYFQDNFDEAIKNLSETLGINLQVKRERNFGKIDFAISKKEKEKAMELLKDEYKFYNQVKNSCN